MRRPGDEDIALTESGGEADVAEVKPEMVEGFLRQYFVARGLEALQENERVAREEMTVFKGGETNTASMPPEAQKRIDTARRVGVSYKRLLDREIELEELRSRLMRERSGSASSEAIVELNPGHKLKIKTWQGRIEKSQKLIASAKAELLAKNPLLAQMIGQRQPRSALSIDLRYAADVLAKGGFDSFKNGFALWDKISGPNNPYEGHELSYGGSQEGDRAVREGYLKKLDDVLQAIGEVKAMVIGGDLRELAGMPGLRHRVMADLATIKGKNSGLGEAARRKLAELGMSAGEIGATVATISGAALQLAGFFFPPLEFLGAVLSFGATAYRLDRSLDAWQVSRAAVTPDQTIGLDPVEAQARLVDETLDLAMEALNTAISFNTALKAIEQGRAPKSFIKELEEGSAGRGHEQAMHAIAEERAADVGRTGRMDNADLTQREIDLELRHIADNPKNIEGTPPHRRARISAEHEWVEQGGIWCRHSADKPPRVCGVPSLPAPEPTVEMLRAIGDPSGVTTFRTHEVPYHNPPRMTTIRGEPLNVHELEPGKTYLWVVDVDGNFIIAPEKQGAFGRNKLYPSGRPVKHGDLVPGEGGATRGIARAGGELRAEIGVDGRPTGRWILDNNSSYTFSRRDKALLSPESLDATHSLLEHYGTDVSQIVVHDVIPR